MPIPEHYVLTPHGLVHENCVNDAGDCPPVRSIRDLFPRTPGGWIESATYTPPEPLGSLSVRFTVPRPPANSSTSVVFLFPGAQNARLSTILQPVLQWGNNGRFGGEYWTIACWWCTPLGCTYHSDPQTVEVGETLLASVNVVAPLGADSADWNIEITPELDQTRRVSLTAEGLKDLMLFVVAGALEAYSLVDTPVLTHDANFFPADTTMFSGIQMKDLNGHGFYADWVPRWPQETGVTGGSQFKVLVSPDGSDVTLVY
jgi:hypothetical protein